MSFNKSRVFSIALTFALALPLSSSLMLGGAVYAGYRAERSYSLIFPDKIPGWERIITPYDGKESNFIRRTYKNNQGVMITIMSRLTSAYRLHDFVKCAKLTDIYLEPYALVVIPADKRSGSPVIYADSFYTLKDGKTRFGINWFQNGNLTAPDESEWQKLVHTNADKIKPPLCKQTYIILENCITNKNIKLLKDTAVYLAGVPLIKS